MKTNHILLLTTTTLTFFFICSNTFAQEAESQKNMAKFNVLPLLGGKFAFEYERLLTDRISAGAAISVRPNRGLPFRSTIKNLMDDEEFNSLVDEFSSSNFSITPEVRFYTSNKGLFKGFYLAPYVKYASYGLTVAYDYEMNVEYEGSPVYSRTETIPLHGDIRSFTAGLSIGFNFKLKDQFYLDWRMVGPGYGTARGDVSGRMMLDNNEQIALRESLDELRGTLENLPLSVKTEHHVHSEGADVTINRSPWAAIRTGLSIGYRF